MSPIPWVVWLILVVVILVVAAVIVLFVTKAWKKTTPPDLTGPQGFQGTDAIGSQGFPGIGTQGFQGTLGFQGLSGDTTPVFSQLPITLSFSSLTNMRFPDFQIQRNCSGVLTVIGNMLTLEFSKVPIVMSVGLTPDFSFQVNLPSGFQLAATNPIQFFVGSCATNRQPSVNSTPIFLSVVTIAPGNAALQLFYESQEGLIWTGENGTATTPLLFCDFTITLFLLP